MRISVAYDFLPKTNSTHASMVMDHFGVGFDTGRHIIVENVELPIQPGDVVLFTGASGSGKSSLLRAAAAELPAFVPSPPLRGRGPGRGGECSKQFETPLPNPLPKGRGDKIKNIRVLNKDNHVLNIDALDLGERILVDGLELPAEETFALLTNCGLGEARLMLRSPAELSDGQRYRYRLALAFANRPAWIVADEFTATLDRTLAKVIAFNLGKTARKRNTGLLLATTHDDVAEDLQPDLHVRCRLDGGIDIDRRDSKKKSSASAATSNSRPARNETGRISLGGIIAATTLVSSAG